MANQIYPPRLPDPPKEYVQDYIRQMLRVINSHQTSDNAQQQATPVVGQINVKPFSATVALSAAQGNVFNIGPMTSNVTSFSLTPGVINQSPDAGLIVYVFFLQDGTGGRTAAFPTGTGNNQFIWANGVVGTLSTAPNALDMLTCVYRVNNALTNVGNWYVSLENGVPGVGAFSSLTVSGLSTLTGGVVTSSMNGGQLAGFRNRIINGNFQINQRGVSGTVTLAAGAYGHDRWKAGAGGCTYTFASSAGVTTLTISAGTLQQVIEGSNLFSGSNTLSWTGSAQGRIDSGAYGVSPQAGTSVGGTNQTIEFNTGTVSLVQYEDGSKATPFEQRFVGSELTLCQRYLPAFQLATSQFLCSAWATASGTGQFFLPFQVQTRIAPTGTNTLTAANYQFSAATGAVFNGITFTAAGTAVNGAFFTFSTASAIVAGQGGGVQATTNVLILFNGVEL